MDMEVQGSGPDDFIASGVQPVVADEFTDPERLLLALDEAGSALASMPIESDAPLS